MRIPSQNYAVGSFILFSAMWLCFVVEQGSLLETMSLTGAVPSFKIKEWLVIVLLFLDALSVSRIPQIAPYISNRNKVSHSKLNHNKR